MKRVLVFYSYFAPAFKAGGPVQSLTNLVRNLNQEYSFYVLCSAFEMGESVVLNGITPNEWHDFADNVKVFYTTTNDINVLNEAFRYSAPDVVYVNGFYVPFYSLLPIRIAKAQKIRVIVAPRGMLQQGALAIKPLKKKIFLHLFKFFRFHKGVKWHATDEQESTDILRVMGCNVADITIAPNIPKVPYPRNTQFPERTEKLKLVYLSLVTEKKNLHLVLLSLKDISVAYELHIYGPIKDKNYWAYCQSLIKDLDDHVQYKGVVDPYEVQSTLSAYDVFILPTKGENFSHAIYEALSVGLPCLISPFTPWEAVREKKAGLIVRPEATEIARAITILACLDGVDFQQMRQRALNVANDYYDSSNFSEAYRKLFN